MASGREYKVLNIPVCLNGKRNLIWSPNKDAVKVLQLKFGLDTMTWINQKMKIMFYPKTSFGKTTTAILPYF
jgi:hypothetical protein